jgi:hypothetical protein
MKTRVRHYTFDTFSCFDWSRLGENTDSNADDENYAKTAHVGVWFNQGGEERLSKVYDTYIEADIEIQSPVPDLSSLIDLAIVLSFYGSGEEFRRTMQAEGYDGLILNDEEYGGTSYVVFSDEQIRLIPPVPHGVAVTDEQAERALQTLSEADALVDELLAKLAEK